ncbi:MAG: hypothetical protein K8J08_05655, partial [Thermoanaerobaculia bacterium]|nr:hypothetical protein [Thermoanaerobaculia bacterium]
MLDAGEVSDEILQDELDRVLTESGDPETLREMLAALEFNPVLARECLARPLVAASLLQQGQPPSYSKASGGKSLADYEGSVGSGVQCLDDSWSSITSFQAPEGGQSSGGVWTGVEMVVWGGFFSGDEGGIYTPATNSWTPISQVNGPHGREGHATFWTGEKMLVWGGSVSSDWDGGLYDPVADSWSPITTVGAGPYRSTPVAVWTGSEMWLWGGRYGNGDLPNDRLRYD